MYESNLICSVLSFFVGFLFVCLLLFLRDNGDGAGQSCSAFILCSS